MSKALKVVQILPYFYPAHIYGGPIQSVYQLCRALSRAGCEVRVLTTDINGSQRLDVPNGREVELEDGVRVRYCHRSALESVSSQLLIRLPEYIKWADVVHLAPIYSFPTMPTLVLARMFRKPLVWSPRGSLQRWEKTRKVALKAMWERVCRTLVSSTAVLHVTSDDEAQASIRRIPLRASVISNGVDIPEHGDRTVSDGRLRLLYIGRLDPQKNIESLLEACSLLSRRGLKASLQIVGSGSPAYTEKLRQRIESLGMNGSVCMRGHLVGEEKEKCFESADIVVLPSFRENFGMVVAEALAHSVPVIAGKGTPWEKLESVGCGMWVDNSPESLAQAIATMSRLPLNEMGRRGREWMKREFSWDSIASQMTALYKEVAGA